MKTRIKQTDKQKLNFNFISIYFLHEIYIDIFLSIHIFNFCNLNFFSL